MYMWAYFYSNFIILWSREKCLALKNSITLKSQTDLQLWKTSLLTWTSVRLEKVLERIKKNFS
jgi:hypothetical protein